VKLMKRLYARDAALKGKGCCPASAPKQAHICNRRGSLSESSLAKLVGKGGGQSNLGDREVWIWLGW